MTPETSPARSALQARRAEIEAAHWEGVSAFDTCASLTQMMDDVIRSAFGTLEASARSQLAVLALGGYGRGELCPYSDIDLMVLRAAGKDLESAGKAAKAFLHLLWDAGVDVGHSVRTVDEALALHGHSVDAWNSMLESRLICGESALAGALFGSLCPKVGVPADRWLIRGVLDGQAAMHERHGNSVKLLEPNVKKSAGGLRDLHSACWLHRAQRPEFFEPNNTERPALKRFLEQLLSVGDLDPDEHEVLVRALEFLLRVRQSMHYLRGSLHDTLEYALQLQVASGLGYRDRVSESDPAAVTRAVEVFMREYYLHARVVHGTSRRLNNRYRELIEPVRHPDHAVENIRGLFLVHSDILSVAPEVTRLSSAEEIFEAFVLAAERELEMDFRLRAVIERSCELISESVLGSPELAGMFGSILRSGRVGATMRAMNDLNILGTYLPEFGRLVAFFQHNVYHYFTADEHTIIALVNAENLRERQGLLREVFRMLRRKEVLYLAILFHDIAKPDGLADHEVTGVAVAERVLARLGMREFLPDVAFLIRHHLLMEQIAFRRNIHDPETIRDFAARFERPELLDYLYVLTYADLSAVNTNVWTEWKATMLQELYQRASEVLRRDLRGVQVEQYHQAKRDAAISRIVDALSASLPRADVEGHVQGLQNDSYFTVFTEEEIARHIAAGNLRSPVDVAFAHSEGYTEVTVIANDAPFALSKFCAVLAANDANILDANIFTRDDGIIIDRFRVADAARHQPLEQRVCTKLADDLEKVMGGTLDIEHLFAEHRRKWKRRPRRPVNPNIRTDVEFEGTGRFTIIDVYAADSVGFLYRVTEAMSRMGLDIYFAKIATRVDGIVDAFYVLDRDGRPLNEQGRQDQVRQGILETIRQLADEELA